MSWVRVPPEQLFFSFYGKRDVQISCVALFDLCRSNNFYVSTQLGVGCHWWFNYPSPLLDVELVCLFIRLG